MRSAMFRRTDPAAGAVNRHGPPALVTEAADIAAPWFAIVDQAAGVDELLIYDTIGAWGTSAQSLVDALAERTASTLNVRINSPGGSVFDGVAIMNALRQHPASVHVFVAGIAASIASVIALAGDSITMRPGSQLMIHDALAGVDLYGYYNAADLADVIAEHERMRTFLDQQSANLAGLYAARAGGTAAAWRQMMLAESWFTADEAVEAGLADQVEAAPAHDGDEPAIARYMRDLLSRTWDLSAFRYAGRDRAPAPSLDAATAAADVDREQDLDLDPELLSQQLKEAFRR